MSENSKYPDVGNQVSNTSQGSVLVEDGDFF